nr:acyl-CoA dehydrogenase family protein [Micromonospora sp. DSM 115978]
MFTQTAEQDLFEATTAQFLTENYPPAHIRALAAPGSSFDDPRWKQGAEFGWTSLLVPESLGGGSISGNGLVDLLSVAFQFGRHAAPGPLLGTNVVAAALARWGSPEQQGGPLAELLDGSATAAWACSPATDGSTGPGLTTASSDDSVGVALTGSVPCVE